MNFWWQANEVTESWTKATNHLMRSFIEANKAGMAMFTDTRSVNADNMNGNEPATLPELTYQEEDWEFERSVDVRSEISVGDYVKFTKTLTDDNVHEFARISGDTNRLHLDEEYAKKTRFGGRIVHGTLISGLISAALARLPGLTIYLSQDVKFLRPVEIGERVTARCEIVEDLGKNRYRLTTIVEGPEGETIIDGEAIVLIDEVPDGTSSD